MGIVVAATTDASQGAIVYLILAGWLVAALANAYFLGLFHLGDLPREPRIPPDRPAWPLTSVAVGAVLAWMVVAPGVYFAVRAGMGRPVSTTQPDLPPADLIGLGIAGPIFGLIVALIGDAGVRPRVGQRLGMAVSRLTRGVPLGLLGAFIAIPLVVWSFQLAELIYRVIGLQHPAEHDLLRVMRELPHPLARFGAIGAAVAVAPLWEELLFRGHIQTLFAVAFTRLRTAPPPSGFAIDPSQPTLVSPVEERPAPPLPPATKWLAIILTSALFALVHPAWTWPAIFVLAICLGYAYEKTNNLWVPIIMHAVFNGLSTWFYLTFNAGN